QPVSAYDNEITRLWSERHRIKQGQPVVFRVENTSEISRVVGIVTGTMTLMLSSIAGISLVVGGVGIMNIMLVSVTERTREIGIWMEGGARGRYILRQVLGVQVWLARLGGGIGAG